MDCEHILEPPLEAVLLGARDCVFGWKQEEYHNLSHENLRSGGNKIPILIHRWVKVMTQNSHLHSDLFTFWFYWVQGTGMIDI